MVRMKRSVAAVLLLLVTLGSFGCLGASLSEEAKPQSAGEHFIVSVETYRLLVDEATEWLVGVTAAAQAGDEAASQYKDAAVEIGKIIAAGNAAFQVGMRAIAAGDQGGIDGAAATLDHLIVQLQAASYAALGGN